MCHTHTGALVAPGAVDAANGVSGKDGASDTGDDVSTLEAVLAFAVGSHDSEDPPHRAKAQKQRWSSARCIACVVLLNVMVTAGVASGPVLSLRINIS